MLCLRAAVPNLNFLIKFNSLRSLGAYYYGKCRSVGPLNLELQSSRVVRPQVVFFNWRKTSVAHYPGMAGRGTVGVGGQLTDRMSDQRDQGVLGFYPRRRATGGDLVVEMSRG